jgi:hypothetical protein
MFPITAVIGKTIRGKYTKCIVFLFLVNELTLACNDLPKHPHIMMPINTHMAYNSSGFPANM